MHTPRAAPIAIPMGRLPIATPIATPIAIPMARPCPLLVVHFFRNVILGSVYEERILLEAPGKCPWCYRDFSERALVAW